MSIFQKWPVPSSKIFVWVFIPYCIKEQDLISGDFDTLTTRQQLLEVFAELGLKWKWQPITFENMHAVVEEVAASALNDIPVVLNYCNRNEIDGYPGISVIKLLEAKGIIFTGADSNCYHLSLSKIWMKRALIDAGVPTAPYEVIADVNSVRGVCDRLDTPIIVKPANSYASRGISVKSVVYTDEELFLQVERLLQGQHGMQFLPDSIFVEHFINGPEFTVLLVGSACRVDSIKIYPPVEWAFHPGLPEIERFLSFERYWGKYEEETPLPPSAPFYRHQSVAPALHGELCELGKRAYCAVGGNGYGRVDIRMDKTSQQLFVLEVNPNCSLSADDQTSVGCILHLSGTPFAQLMSEIIAEAFANASVPINSIN